MSLPFPSGQKVFNTDLNPILLGWIAFSWAGSTLAYVSADAPTFVFSINADVTAVIEPGMRIRLTQTTDKFFIVTAVGAFAAGVTPITVYGGTDYTLANAAISAGAFSMSKKPFGFNVNPAKWTVELNDVSTRTVSSPTASVWLNPSALSLSIPIGLWRVSHAESGFINVGAAGAFALFATLSTANNTQSDPDFTSYAAVYSSSTLVSVPHGREKVILLAAKTSYFLNIQTTNSATSIGWNGTVEPTIVRAVCAYL